MTPATCVLLVLQEVLLTLKGDETRDALQLLRFALVLQVQRCQTEVPLASYARVGQKAQVMKAVAQKDAFCREGQAAVGTEEYTFIVSLEMVQHGAVMAEAAFALWARVTFHAPLVCVHVPLALCHAGENALAEITLIELLFKMVCVQMLLQVVLCRKLGCANDALDNGRLRVRAQVLTIVD